MTVVNNWWMWMDVNLVILLTWIFFLFIIICLNMFLPYVYWTKLFHGYTLHQINLFTFTTKTTSSQQITLLALLKTCFKILIFNNWISPHHRIIPSKASGRLYWVIAQPYSWGLIVSLQYTVYLWYDPFGRKCWGRKLHANKTFGLNVELHVDARTEYSAVGHWLTHCINVTSKLSC